MNQDDGDANEDDTDFLDDTGSTVSLLSVIILSTFAELSDVRREPGY